MISFLSKGLSRVLQHHNLKASVLQCSPFFMVQPSHPYMTRGKIIFSIPTGEHIHATGHLAPLQADPRGGRVPWQNLGQGAWPRNGISVEFVCRLITPVPHLEHTLLQKLCIYPCCFSEPTATPHQSRQQPDPNGIMNHPREVKSYSNKHNLGSVQGLRSLS